MIKLSAVIITYNEEENIGKCLNSVKDLADEILVVDSFSEDRTTAICSEYGAKVLKHQFKGHIEQKNWAFSHAKYHHILSLDADEEISDTLKIAIEKVKESWNSDGYYFNRLNKYCGKWIRHGGWAPDKKFRLVDRRKGEWKGINPHDKFILDPGSKAQKLPGHILHYTYSTIQEHIKQINRYTEIIAYNFFYEGIRSNFFKIFFNPTWKFFRNYILRLGFLDGFSGIVLNANIAYETFLKYIKLRQLTKHYRKRKLDYKTLKSKKEYIIKNDKLIDTIPN